jgi:hypothetical protein
VDNSGGKFLGRPAGINKRPHQAEAPPSGSDNTGGRQRAANGVESETYSRSALGMLSEALEPFGKLHDLCVSIARIHCSGDLAQLSGRLAVFIGFRLHLDHASP